MNRNSNSSDDYDDGTMSAWDLRSCCRVLVVMILAGLAVGTTSTLAVVLYKDDLREKALAEKKKGWVQKWMIIEPYVKKFPMGFLLGFVRNLIVLAIEREVDA